MTFLTRGFGRLALLAVLACALSAASVSAASATASSPPVPVNLRVEGTADTFFNGSLTTGPRSVPGGVNSPYCHADSSDASFSFPNTFTALADALGAANITTSGGYATGFGVQLCSVNGEGTPPTGGWLVKINNKNVSAPAGYVTAGDELSAGDSALVYRVTTFDSSAPDYIAGNLELKLPAHAAPGQPVAAQVNYYSDADDSKSTPAGVTVSGGGATSTTDSSGAATIAFPASGKFLVRATKSHAVRGSAWIEIDPATPAPPQKINRFVKCQSTYKGSSKKTKKKLRRCYRIVRAKQAKAAKGH